MSCKLRLRMTRGNDTNFEARKFRNLILVERTVRFYPASSCSRRQLGLRLWWWWQSSSWSSHSWGYTVMHRSVVVFVSSPSHLPLFLPPALVVFPVSVRGEVEAKGETVVAGVAGYRNGAEQCRGVVEVTMRLSGKVFL